MMKRDITGIILKGKRCEYSDYCGKSGVRCLHIGEYLSTNYECGYCKAFRLIDISRKAKNISLAIWLFVFCQYDR